MDLETTKLSIEWVATERLFCSPANPRRNDDAVPHVAASIRRFGFRQPIVARPSGEVVAGNTRLKAAISLGLADVPVAWFDGSDIEATACAIADSRTHEFAEWDDQSLAALLETLRAEDALDGVGFSDADIDALLAELAASLPDVDLNDPGPEEPPERPVSRLGDLWLLREHRLLCGDSTSPDALARLMDGEKAHLLATDPPDLVDYTASNPALVVQPARDGVVVQHRLRLLAGARFCPARCHAGQHSREPCPTSRAGDAETQRGFRGEVGRSAPHARLSRTSRRRSRRNAPRVTPAG